MYLPNRKGQKQAPGSSIQQTASDLDIQCRPDRPTNANELDMSRLQFSMGTIISDLRKYSSAYTIFLVLPSVSRQVGGYIP